MRKIQYGIIGFVTGISAGLLLGIVELKIMKRLEWETAIPFVIGITVIIAIITGVSTGVRIAGREGK